MAFLKIFKRKVDNVDQENVGKAMSETANDIIKRLAGGEIKYTRKLIDNVVVITNAAGGTGASTIVSNVAHMANKRGMRVLVIDLNIMLPVQHSYFNIKQEIERPDLISYLIGKNSIGESMVNKDGISLLYANNRGLIEYINSESDLAVTNLNVAIDRLRQLYDLILIDTPMRIEHTLVNTVFYNCDQIYIVWDEGISSIANTERIRRNMAISGIDAYTKMKVIMNKRTSIHYSNYPFQKLNIELVGVLPFESDIIDASLRSQIFCDSYASNSKNASIFYNEIDNITLKILKNGGYIE